MNYLIDYKGAYAWCINIPDNQRFKILLRMKLFIVSMLLFLGQANAVVRSQTLTLHFTNAPLEKVLIEIKKQTGYSYIANVRLLKEAKAVTVSVRNGNVNDVLKTIFKDQSLSAELSDGIIHIEAKKGEANQIKPAKDQDAIRGRVTDQNGNPLAGATLKIKGTNIVSVTDQAGEFTLPAPDLNSTIEITFLGHNTKEVTYKGVNNINISLSNSESAIQEVEVNAGYWKVSDKLRTGNISKVDGETIRQQPVSDPMLALAGRVPGLVVSQNSGLPGSYHWLRIRGANSLANGNDPLFLIDGLPFNSGPLTNNAIGYGATRISPFALLNAEEIESIEVLKDADATAIYGSRGANGVILITTKKGHSGKTSININALTGFGKVTRMMDLLNTEQYLEMRREAFANDGVTTYPANAYDVNGTWDQNRYTDWQKILLGNTSHMSNIQGQISGGSALTQFTTGGGYARESTVFPGDYNTQKASANFNLNHQSDNKKFSITLSTRYANNHTEQPQIDFSVNNIRLSPNAPALYDDAGNLNWENDTWTNPLGETKKRLRLNSKNIIANSSLNYKLLSTLELKLNLGYNDLSTLQSNLTPITAFSPSRALLSTRRRHDRAESSHNTWIIEPQANFSKKIGSGNLEATIGSTFQKTESSVFAQQASNFTDDALLENIKAAATIQIAENNQTEYRYAALFGRINYNWQDKYLINLVARRDGSSRFASGRKYGNFASVGAAWIFSNEPLFSNSALSFGKIRGSVGVTGNDQLRDYQYLSTYSSYGSPYLGITGLYPTRLYSADYGWEAVRKVEVALDLGFWANRIKLSTIYYRNRTDNQLVGYSLPTMTGFPSIQGNLPAVLENRGWEWELNTVNIVHDQFTWNTSFNISLPDSKLISYPDFENSTYRNIYEVGKPLSILKAWHWTGVDPETGLHTFEDLDGDGKATSPQDLQALVNTAQRYYGGLSNSVTYKGFSLDVFFQFVKRTGSRLGGVPGGFLNQQTHVMDRWQKPGDITDTQRFTQSGIAATTMIGGLNNSDMLYGDASFLRMKNLSLSYQLPTKFVNRYRFTQCRIFAQCQNLFTLTSYRGADPETPVELAPIRMITAGINFTL